MRKKIFIYSIIALATILIILSYILPDKPEITIQTPNQEQAAAIAQGTEQASQNYKLIEIQNTVELNTGDTKNSQTQSSKTNSSQTNPDSKTIPVTFRVRTQSYLTQIPENSTVHEAMKILASTTSFTFHANMTSSLGYFVDEINSIKNRNDAFWIYYVNGNQANLGISSYKLKANDTVVWKLEDSLKREILN